MTPKYNPLRLSPFIVALICYLLPCASPAPAAHHDPQLDPYIEFLGHQTTSAKEYVLGMFKDHDLVILCERDHRDTTQYNLFLSVIRDEWFIKNVGIVFTEVGTSSLNPELNAFLHSDNLPADSVDRAILNFHRNCDWFLMWEKTNFSLFLHGVYAINRTLPPKDKLTLYPSDMPLDWSQMDSAKYAAFQGTLGGRDSVMAAEIIDQFEKLDKPDAGHRKALVIMNYRHAFNRHFPKPSGGIVRNVGGYLADRFGSRVANVYVNFARWMLGSTDQEVTLAAIQDGKWDAAVKALGRGDVGFDFEGSPFGEDHFDIWPYTNHSFRYQDVFTGFVYYLSPEGFRPVVGIPGIIDSAFLPEFMRRQRLERLVKGLDPNAANTPSEIERDYNTERAVETPNLDSIKTQINKWLH